MILRFIKPLIFFVLTSLFWSEYAASESMYPKKLKVKKMKNYFQTYCKNLDLHLKSCEPYECSYTNDNFKSRYRKYVVKGKKGNTCHFVTYYKFPEEQEKTFLYKKKECFLKNYQETGYSKLFWRIRQKIDGTRIYSGTYNDCKLFYQ